MINVTKTYLPDMNKFKNYIDKIYETGWITNNGKCVNELEKRLKDYLGVKNLLLVSNGTMALQIAYKLLKLKGEVITTPFSFVATTSSLVWEGLNPVFSDINKNTFCIDPNKITDKITSNTSAILPVHTFGNGCEVELIDSISKEYGLKVIYDAAHAFNIKYKNESILNYGDISIVSFHATKIFHTIEGGALIIKDDYLYEKARKIINFGITGPDKIEELGINAKINEFQAAMGLCVLDDVDNEMNYRRVVYRRYESAFKNMKNIKLQEHNKNCNYNYGYFSIVLNDEKTVYKVKYELERHNIYPRRYFYPSLDKLNYIKSEYMEYSNNISERILCLPLYSTLSLQEQELIIDIIRKCIQ
ncbi:DegT/DnrJ/EryC1/StrS family aminotransferase [Clostridium sp. YIM B02506]|uniref:DegT/DnrJ/EryC1/StrS family aminotransferase n=1 Tax=Clostridium sp. YIM B02506 TaxID=2910680 RepID=UPI001EEF75AD|nr:DegT/DnrJ/EryC1/StrS family aminotransferase [Clostridium sp. YIM B02506]